MKLTTKRLLGVIILVALPFLGKAQMNINVSIDQPGIEECVAASVDELQQKENFKVFPNPAETNINVSWTNIQLQGDAEIAIYNYLGQKVYSEIINANGSLQAEIDITGFAKGIYIIRACCNQVNALQKLIIANN